MEKSLKKRAAKINEILKINYPGSPKSLCALKHENAYELLVATILSAQCTDERVNEVMKSFVLRFPRVEDLAAASLEEIEKIILPTGFYKNKAKSLKAAAKYIVENYNSKVPDNMEELIKLSGVGRKTANVILSVYFNKPGLPVDTHVARISRRLGFTSESSPEKIEEDLCRLLDENEWGGFSLRLILHGRKVCKARNPMCSECVLIDECPTGQKLLLS